MDERENIIQENLRRIFQRIEKADSYFEWQAEELIRLLGKDEAADSYLAYDIVGVECERMRELPFSATSLWLNSLSEVIYERLKNTEDEKTMFEDFGFSDEVDARIEGRVSYLKSKFTSLAFDRFDSLIPDSKSHYTSSFESSAESVFNGVSEYCILPVANSRDGALPTFLKMISKFDLRVSATTDIEDYDGQVTTMALLTRGIRTPKRDMLPSYRFEFFISGLTNKALSGILFSAEKHGLSLFALNSSAFGEESSGMTLTFSLDRATFASFKAFVFTLLAVFPSFAPRGLYIHF